MDLMNNQIQNIRNEFISVLKDLTNKFDITKSENTYFQTMEQIMNNGSLQRKQTDQVDSVENLNIAQEQSETVTQNISEYNLPYQNNTSRDTSSK